jgi:hypothetical protein
MNQAAEAGAFRHLLHDVASRITGLGMTLDLLHQAGEVSGEPAELVNEARQATVTLRHLVSDLGELGAFMARRGPSRPTPVRPVDLLRELRAAGPSGMPRAVSLECAETLPPVMIDRALVGYLLAILARASWRHNGETPLVRGSLLDGAAVAFDVIVVRPSEASASDRWPYDKPPYSLDHLCADVVQGSGGRFERLVTSSERIVRIAFPIASARLGD